MFKPLVALTAGLLLGPLPLCAIQLFEATTAHGGITASSSSSRFDDMIDSAVRLALTRITTNPGPFTATVTYLGAPSTFTVTPGFDGTTLSLHVKSVGFEKTFTGTSTAEVGKKVEQYLRSDSAAIITNFSQAAALTSAFSITDGNPASSTASAARSIFFNQGLSLAQDSADDKTTAGSAFGLGSLSVSRGTIEADIAGRTYRGEQVRIDATLLSLRVNDRLRLELPITAEYSDIEETEFFGAGATLVAPISIITDSPEHPFGWKVVPVLGVHSRGSFDAGAGGISWHVGLVSVANWRLGDRFAFSVINQITTHQDLPVDVGDYAFDSNINQTILKNGLRLTTVLTPKLQNNLYLIDTRFLNEAAVESYYTAGASLDFRAGRQMSAGVGIESDFADNYRSLLVRLYLNWTW